MLTGKRQNSARKARQATFRTLDPGVGQFKGGGKKGIYERRRYKGPSLATRLIHGATPPGSTSRMAFACRHDPGENSRTLLQVSYTLFDRVKTSREAIYNVAQGQS